MSDHQDYLEMRDTSLLFVPDGQAMPVKGITRHARERLGAVLIALGTHKGSIMGRYPFRKHAANSMPLCIYRQSVDRKNNGR